MKTSYIVLERRAAANQENPPVFMYPCQFVGNDDPKRQRPRAGDAELRELALQEIEDVMAAYERFQEGTGNPDLVVPSARIADRLDVKNCLMSPGRQEQVWEEQSLRIIRLEEMLEVRTYEADELITKDHPDPVAVMVVRYEGIAEAGEEINPADSSYAKLFPVSAGDIVISNIAASHGSIAVVPDHLDGSVVSSEYTVLTAKEGFDPIVLQLILRSPELIPK